MSGEGDWFTEVEHPRRVRLATVWSLGVSGLSCAVLTLLSSLYQNPLQPSLAITRLLTPSSTTLYIIMLSVISVWTSLLHSCSYSVTQSKMRSLSSIIFSMLQPGMMLSLVMFSCQGLVTAWCFIRVSWPTLTQDERFVAGSGLVTGLIMGYQYCLQSRNTLQFPLINKQTSYLAREVFCVEESVVASVRILQYYLISSIVFSLVFYQTLPCSVSLSAPVSAGVITLFLVMSHNIRLKIFSLVLTSPLTSLTHAQLLTNLTLATSSPLLRLLCLQSISEQTRTSPDIRSHLFSLSQPGGHPTHWRTINKVCMDHIKSVFPKDVTKTTAEVAAAPPVTQLGTPGMRRLEGSERSGSRLEDVSLTPAPQLMSLSSTLDKLRKTGAAGDDAEHDTLSIISSVNILSQLICFSISEDRFGVVQKDLSDMISTLVRLEAEMTSMKLHRAETIRRAISAALYRISGKFGGHLEDIPLPGHVKQKMKIYANYLQV